MKRSLKRILSNITCLLLLSAGSLFTIFFFGKVELSDDFKVGTRYVTLFAVILMAIIFLIELSSQLLNKNASKTTMLLSVLTLGFILSSRDSINMVAYFGEVKYPIVYDLLHSLFFFSAMFVILFFYCRDYQIDSKYFLLIGLVSAIALFTADIFSIIFDFQFYTALIIMSLTLVIYFTFFFISYQKRTMDNRFVIIGFIFFTIIY